MSEKGSRDEFNKVIKDFYKDILLTFPEYKNKLGDDVLDFLMGNGSSDELFKYCCKVYPERFFDILYENEEIFTDMSYNTYFLPNIDFKELWIENISDKTRKTIWKYLQLVLFSTSSELKSGESFGNTAKLFEAIPEEELKNKLEETMGQMKELFGDLSMNMFEGVSGENLNTADLPNPEELQ